MKKTWIATLALCLALGLTACGPKAEGNNAPAEENKVENAQAANNEAQTEEAAEDASVPTKENPMVVDKENNTVKIYAEVNEKYKDESTMHMIVARDGKESNHAMFISDAKALEFHDALESLGLKAGNNMTKDNMGKAQVEGDALDVSFQFDGNDKIFTVDEVVADSSG